MATPIRPIPTLYGEDAKRFVEAAEAAERNYRFGNESRGGCKDLEQNF